MSTDNIINGYDSSENCTSGSTGVYNVFNMCLVSVVQHIGFGVSFIAIALWFGSDVLILKTNHQEFKRSFNRLFFTLHLATGNVCNLVGCLLSNQIGTMVLTAIYFLVMDAIFIGQYIYYLYVRKPRSQDGFQYSNFSHLGVVNNPEWKKNKQKKGGSLSRHKMNGSGFQVLCIGTYCFVTISYLSSWLIPRPQTGASIQKWSPTGRVLLGRKDFLLQDDVEVAGYIIGSISTLLYCAYKIPEVISMKRHRTHMGRSFYCHFLQIFANIAYVLSILSYDRGTDYVRNTLPWTIGSIGMISFDLIILYHILKYKRPKPNSSKRLRNSSAYRIADSNDAEDPNSNGMEGDEGDADSWVQMGDVSGSLQRIDEEEEEDEERQRVVDMVTTHAKIELVTNENYDTVSKTTASELSYVSSNNSVYMDTVDEPITQLETQDLEWDEADISRTVDTSQQEELRDKDVMAEIEQELGMSVEAFLAADSTTIRSPKTAEFMREQEDMGNAGEMVVVEGEMVEKGDIEEGFEEFWEELNVMKP